MDLYDRYVNQANALQILKWAVRGKKCGYEEE